MRVVIIGAGVAGLSIGWRLLQAGCDVVVLERAQPGQGATWASAGMIAVTGENGDTATPEAKLARYSGSLWPSFAGASVIFGCADALAVSTSQTI